MIITPIRNDSEDRIVCPAGEHGAVCSGVYDLGLHPGYEDEKPVHKLAVLFEVDATIPSGKHKGERYLLSKIITVDYRNNTALMHCLRSMDEEDAVYKADGQNNLDEQRMVEKACQIQVTHEYRNGNTYAKIEAFDRHPRGPTGVRLMARSQKAPDWVKNMRQKALKPPETADYNDLIAVIDAELNAEPNAEPNATETIEVITAEATPTTTPTATPKITPPQPAAALTTSNVAATEDVTIDLFEV